MTYEEINEMMQEIGLPYAYHHFAEGESPNPPFSIFLSPGEHTFGADDLMYISFKTLHIELYTDEPDFELEAAVEAALTAAELTFERPEQVYIDSERMYQTTYNTEVLLTDAE